MRIILLALSLLITACSMSVVTQDGTQMRIASDGFRDYAESVFRMQNELASELVFAIESDEISDDGVRRLETAETDLIDACAGINGVAVRQRDGEGRQILTDRQAALEVPQCERAVHAVRQVLDAVAP